jgi:hypothetical protein
LHRWYRGTATSLLQREWDEEELVTSADSSVPQSDNGRTGLAAAKKSREQAKSKPRRKSGETRDAILRGRVQASVAARERERGEKKSEREGERNEEGRNQRWDGPARTGPVSQHGR